MASKLVTKTAAELRREYEAAAEKCAAIAVAIKKAEPELQKRVQAELGRMGLDLQGAKDAKRKLWTAWEQARDAEGAAIEPPASIAQGQRLIAGGAAQSAAA
jgi:hypothetical protein